MGSYQALNKWLIEQTHAWANGGAEGDITPQAGAVTRDCPEETHLGAPASCSQQGAPECLDGLLFGALL